MNRDAAGFALHRDTLACHIIEALSVDLDCRVHGRDLFDLSDKCGSCPKDTVSDQLLFIFSVHILFSLIYSGLPGSRLHLKGGFHPGFEDHCRDFFIRDLVKDLSAHILSIRQNAQAHESNVFFFPVCNQFTDPGGISQTHGEDSLRVRIKGSCMTDPAHPKDPAQAGHCVAGGVAGLFIHCQHSMMHSSPFCIFELCADHVDHALDGDGNVLTGLDGASAGAHMSAPAELQGNQGDINDSV